jgi:hypothetical protein
MAGSPKAEARNPKEGRNPKIEENFCKQSHIVQRFRPVEFFSLWLS